MDVPTSFNLTFSLEAFSCFLYEDDDEGTTNNSIPPLMQLDFRSVKASGALQGRVDSNEQETIQWQFLAEVSVKHRKDQILSFRPNYPANVTKSGDSVTDEKMKKSETCLVIESVSSLMSGAAGAMKISHDVCPKRGNVLSIVMRAEPVQLVIKPELLKAMLTFFESVFETSDSSGVAMERPMPEISDDNPDGVVSRIANSDLFQDLVGKSDAPPMREKFADKVFLDVQVAAPIFRYHAADAGVVEAHLGVFSLKSPAPCSYEDVDLRFSLDEMQLNCVTPKGKVRSILRPLPVRICVQITDFGKDIKVQWTLGNLSINVDPIATHILLQVPASISAALHRQIKTDDSIVLTKKKFIIEKDAITARQLWEKVRTHASIVAAQERFSDASDSDAFQTPEEGEEGSMVDTNEDLNEAVEKVFEETKKKRKKSVKPVNLNVSFQISRFGFSLFDNKDRHVLKAELLNFNSSIVSENSNVTAFISIERLDVSDPWTQTCIFISSGGAISNVTGDAERMERDDKHRSLSISKSEIQAITQQTVKNADDGNEESIPSLEIKVESTAANSTFVTIEGAPLLLNWNAGCMYRINMALEEVKRIAQQEELNETRQQIILNINETKNFIVREAEKAVPYIPNNLSQNLDRMANNLSVLTQPRSSLAETFPGREVVEMGLTSSKGLPDVGGWRHKNNSNDNDDSQSLVVNCTFQGAAVYFWKNKKPLMRMGIRGLGVFATVHSDLDIEGSLSLEGAVVYVGNRCVIAPGSKDKAVMTVAVRLYNAPDTSSILPPFSCCVIGKLYQVCCLFYNADLSTFLQYFSQDIMAPLFGQTQKTTTPTHSPTRPKLPYWTSPSKPAMSDKSSPRRNNESPPVSVSFLVDDVASIDSQLPPTPPPPPERRVLFCFYIECPLIHLPENKSVIPSLTKESLSNFRRIEKDTYEDVSTPTSATDDGLINSKLIMVHYKDLMSGQVDLSSVGAYASIDLGTLELCNYYSREQAKGVTDDQEAEDQIIFIYCVLVQLSGMQLAIEDPTHAASGTVLQQVNGTLTLQLSAIMECSIELSDLVVTFLRPQVTLLMDIINENLTGSGYSTRKPPKSISYSLEANELNKSNVIKEDKNEEEEIEDTSDDPFKIRVQIRIPEVRFELAFSVDQSLVSFSFVKFLFHVDATMTKTALTYGVGIYGHEFVMKDLRTVSANHYKLLGECRHMKSIPRGAMQGTLLSGEEVKDAAIKFECIQRESGREILVVLENPTIYVLMILMLDIVRWGSSAWSQCTMSKYPKPAPAVIKKKTIDETLDDDTAPVTRIRVFILKAAFKLFTDVHSSTSPLLSCSGDLLVDCSMGQESYQLHQIDFIGLKVRRVEIEEVGEHFKERHEVLLCDDLSIKGLGTYSPGEVVTVVDISFTIPSLVIRLSSRDLALILRALSNIFADKPSIAPTLLPIEPSASADEDDSSSVTSSTEASQSVVKYSKYILTAKLESICVTFLDDIRSTVVPLFRMFISCPKLYYFSMPNTTQISLNDFHPRVECLNPRVGGWEPVLESCCLNLRYGPPGCNLSEMTENPPNWRDWRPSTILQVAVTEFIVNVSPQMTQLLIWFVPYLLAHLTFNEESDKTEKKNERLMYGDGAAFHVLNITGLPWDASVTSENDQDMDVEVENDGSMIKKKKANSLEEIKNTSESIALDSFIMAGETVNSMRRSADKLRYIMISRGILHQEANRICSMFMDKGVPRFPVEAIKAHLFNIRDVDATVQDCLEDKIDKLLTMPIFSRRHAVPVVLSHTGCFILPSPSLALAPSETKHFSSPSRAALNRTSLGSRSSFAPQPKGKQSLSSRGSFNFFGQDSNHPLIAQVVTPHPSRKLILLSTTVKLFNQTDIPLEVQFVGYSNSIVQFNKDPIRISSISNLCGTERNYEACGYAESFSSFHDLNNSSKQSRESSNSILIPPFHFLTPPQEAFFSRDNLVFQFRPLGTQTQWCRLETANECGLKFKCCKSSGQGSAVYFTARVLSYLSSLPARLYLTDVSIFPAFTLVNSTPTPLLFEFQNNNRTQTIDVVPRTNYHVYEVIPDQSETTCSISFSSLKTDKGKSECSKPLTVFQVSSDKIPWNIEVPTTQNNAPVYLVVNRKMPTNFIGGPESSSSNDQSIVSQQSAFFTLLFNPFMLVVSAPRWLVNRTGLNLRFSHQSRLLVSFEGGVYLLGAPLSAKKSQGSEEGTGEPVFSIHSPTQNNDPKKQQKSIGCAAQVPPIDSFFPVNLTGDKNSIMPLVLHTHQIGKNITAGSLCRVVTVKPSLLICNQTSTSIDGNEVKPCTLEVTQMHSDVLSICIEAGETKPLHMAIPPGGVNVGSTNSRQFRFRPKDEDAIWTPVLASEQTSGVTPVTVSNTKNHSWKVFSVEVAPDCGMLAVTIRQSSSFLLVNRVREILSVIALPYCLVPDCESNQPYHRLAAHSTVEMLKKQPKNWVEAKYGESVPIGWSDPFFLPPEGRCVRILVRLKENFIAPPTPLIVECVVTQNQSYGRSGALRIVVDKYPQITILLEKHGDETWIVAEHTTVVKKRTQAVPKTEIPIMPTNQIVNIQVELTVSHLGISLISDVRRQELLYGEIRGVRIAMFQSPQGHQYQLEIADVQLDCQLDESKAPVCFTNIREKNRAAFLLSLQRNFPNARDIYLAYVFCEMDAVDIVCDEALCIGVIDFYTECLMILGGSTTSGVSMIELHEWAKVPFHNNFIPPPKPSVVQVDQIEIRDTELGVSCAVPLRVLQVLPDIIFFALQVIFLSGNVEIRNSKISLPGHVFTNMRGTVNSILSCIKDHYYHKVTSSLAIMSGVFMSSSFMNIPKVPVDLTAQTLGIVDTLLSGSSQLIGNLSFDPEYINAEQRKRQSGKPVKSLGGGMMRAGQHLGEGFASLGNIVTKPVAGAQKHGPLGFFQGLGQGVMGTLVKPVDKVGQAFASVVEGVKAQFEPSIEERKKFLERRRRPRMLWGELGSIRDYDEESARVRQMLGFSLSRDVTQIIYVSKSSSENIDLILLVGPQLTLCDLREGTNEGRVVWTFKTNDLRAVHASSHGVVAMVSTPEGEKAFQISSSSASQITNVHSNLRSIIGSSAFV
eukprot:GHVL01038823.1.p1 GENE.GHVL01038823.1~~GHVL01038823.1.p1  ORF type:complete len:3511 (+),score=609.16 GHVL01038823.1:1273-10533(+)